MAQIKTSEPWHPNTSISFDENGIWLRVSLNIEPGLAKYLSPNNIIKGKQRTVYALRSFIQSDYICKDSMQTVHNMLLSNCMKNIRNAKQKRDDT